MLILVWVLYTIVGVAAFSLVFIWAVRARQFWHQDEARYLALEDEDAGADEPAAEPAPARPGAGVLAPIVVVAGALVLVIVTIIRVYAGG